MRKEDRRNEQSKKAIKDGLLKVLESKPLAQAGVSEVVRAAGISRSTFYVHYNNLQEVFADLVNEMHVETRTLKEQLNCQECQAGQARPFCTLVRDEGRYAPLVRDPYFMRASTSGRGLGFERDVYEDLARSGMPGYVAEAIFQFQMNGCYAAARYVNDDEQWTQVRAALDTFIAAGLKALRL